MSRIKDQAILLMQNLYELSPRANNLFLPFGTYDKTTFDNLSSVLLFLGLLFYLYLP